MTGEAYTVLYYAENGKRLRQIVDQILKKFGGIFHKDLDDFYSLANEVFVEVLRQYQPPGDFQGFLYTCLDHRIKTEITRRNRQKRMADQTCISLQAAADAMEDCCVEDMLASELNVEEEVLCRLEVFDDQRMEQFWKRLSGIQQQILTCRMQDFSVGEIKRILKLSDTQYARNWKEIVSFDSLRQLHQNRKGARESRKELTGMQVCTQSMEKSKQSKMTIASVNKKIDTYTIRFDHPMQREADQWNLVMKGNLVSDILQGNPIPPLVFAEQILNGTAVIWDLDGKQRSTTAYTFTKDGFKISRNIRRWEIAYQSPKRDESGRILLDKNGYPDVQMKVCDIRGKHFSDLPEELQDRFLDYNFEVVEYLNCTEEDIAYHMARYNEGKPMTVSQKGMTRLGKEFASLVRQIAGMPFFRELGAYKVSERNNGTIYRVVIESVMACYFLEDWKKKQEDMCAYLRTHAVSAQFEAFQDLTERITAAGNPKVFQMFHAKDSFLWFALFSKFRELHLPDARYISFLEAFQDRLHGKLVDGISFDDLDGKSTKDRSVVLGKMKHLELLLDGFLQQKEVA